MYRIREVDALDEEMADTLDDLHRLTFFQSAPIPEFSLGSWWIAFQDRTAVAFAGLVPSTHVHNAGYCCRVGVIDRHRGNALQIRFLRAIEGRARRNGWEAVVSDTTCNVTSANNFIRAGYCLYEPDFPWGWSSTLYWRKLVGDRSKLLRG
jgi:hypothetical protein